MASCCAKLNGNAHPLQVRKRDIGKVSTGFWGETFGTSLWSSTFRNLPWKSLRKEIRAQTINSAVLPPDVDEANLVSIHMQWMI